MMTFIDLFERIWYNANIGNTWKGGWHLSLMTEWHLAWQAEFPVQDQEAVMEAAGLSRRADVLLHNTVLEFQHSYISDMEWTERTWFYSEEHGLDVFWVYDFTEGDIRDFFSGDAVSRLCVRQAGFDSEKPFFLDYGPCVVMCAVRPDGTGCDAYPLTHAGFIEFVGMWDAYPKRVRDAMPVRSYIQDNLNWFLLAMRPFSSFRPDLEHDGPEVLALHGCHVVRVYGVSSSAKYLDVGPDGRGPCISSGLHRRCCHCPDEDLSEILAEARRTWPDLTFQEETLDLSFVGETLIRLLGS